MNSFFQTEPFSCALMEALDYVACGGADMGECLSAAGSVHENDRESWYIAWNGLAERVRRGAAPVLADGQARGARDAFLRAALYYRMAGRFLEREPLDPRASTADGASEACFATAMRLSSPLCETVEVAHGGARRTGYIHRADAGERPGATLLVAGGAGATPLELYFACAVAAARCGWHCLAVGPGAETDGPALTHSLVDAAVTLPCVDPGCLAVLAFRGGNEAPFQDGGGRRRLARPLAMGNAEEVLRVLRGCAECGGTAITAADAAEERSCSGALGRFHQGLSRWLDGHA